MPSYRPTRRGRNDMVEESEEMVEVANGVTVARWIFQIGLVVGDLWGCQIERLIAHLLIHGVEQQPQS